MARKKLLGVSSILMSALAVSGGSAQAADAQPFELYGFLMVDYIQDFGRLNPDWEDTLRPSRIPTDDEQFGGDGKSIVSVKQSRLGVKGSVPTPKGDIYTRFEFDIFGVGDDAGQTTFRLRHAYGEYGQFLAGQTNSLFMDGDIFPNTIDYWGPNGMVFLRNPQIRWTPVKGNNSFAIAIENPGNDIDDGQFRTVPNFPGAQADEEYPDLTAQFRTNGDWGHVQLAGILRWVGAEVVNNNQVAYEDDDMGWGLNVTTVINVFEKDAIRAGVVYGEGIASYMNDGGMDAGPDQAPGTPGTKIEAVELLGVSAYYDHWWSDQWSSSIGYSWVEVDNTDGQTPDTFEKASYASANLLYYPVKNVMIGAEALWGEREDFGGASNDDTRIQISFKYDFNRPI